MKYKKPRLDLPDYVDLEERIIFYKRLWGGLYCGVDDEANRYYLCSQSIADKLSPAALALSRKIERYYCFHQGCIGILIYELSHLPAFIDYDPEERLRLLYLATLEYPVYFRETQLKISGAILKRQAELYALQHNLPEPYDVGKLRLFPMSQPKKDGVTVTMI